MVDYDPQQRQFNPNRYTAVSAYYRYPITPNQPAQEKHHHYVLLAIVIIAAVISTLLIISYTDIWNIGIGQYNDGEELPPALPSENAPRQFAADSSNDVPPSLPDFF